MHCWEVCLLSSAVVFSIAVAAGHEGEEDEGLRCEGGREKMSVRALHVKRKEPDEIVVDLLRNVSLSPTKKVRLGVRALC